MTATLPLRDTLKGIHCLDLTRNLPGPFATRILADWGAEVTKVEAPGGDEARGLPPLFERLNHGKPSWTLDLKKPEDREQLIERVRSTDILIEGFRPGIMQDQGLGYARLKQINPRLVMCSITGYGQAGPWAHRAGHDLNFMAVSGVLDQMRDPRGRPLLGNVQWGDMASGSMLAVSSILAALIAVQRGQEGRHIDISMSHGLRHYLVMAESTGPMMAAMLQRTPGPAEDLLSGALPCYRLYETLDHEWLAVAALEYKFWSRAAEGLGHPEWAEQHWQRGLLPNSPASQAMIAQVAQVIAAQNVQYWTERFENIDACVTPVLSLAQAAKHPLFA